MAERGAIKAAQLGDREGRGREREADVGVGKLRAKPLAACEDDRQVVECELGEVIDGVPTAPAR